MSQHIYRYKKDGQLYTIEHLIHDIKNLNRNAFSGIYAYPYRWKGSKVCYTKQMHLLYPHQDPFNPLKFVEDNFEIVAELL